MNAHPPAWPLADLLAPPLSLYVHLPWCVRKCPYCDFNSYQAPGGELPQEPYVEALLADLSADAPLAHGRRVETIFFGGGTPSLFAPESIARLIEAFAALTDVASDAEVTLEANPGTIERGRFEGYRQAGVNRISLGAQSFAAAQLASLGRIHTSDDTRRSVAELSSAGLSNFNLDLMYALPNQTPALARADLDQALALGAPHLSYYHLTLEPGTAFHRAPPPLPDEDEAEAIEAESCRRLSEAGYERYEISAWGRAGAACRHNLNYWRFGDYLGIGAGAHGKLTWPAAGTIVRTVKARNPSTYLRSAGAGSGGERRLVPVLQRPFEYVLNATRLAAGFLPAEFEARTGVGFGAIEPTVERLVARGLLSAAAGRLRATALGWRFLNDLQSAFLIS